MTLLNHNSEAAYCDTSVSSLPYLNNLFQNFYSFFGLFVLFFGGFFWQNMYLFMKDLPFIESVKVFNLETFHWNVFDQLPSFYLLLFASAFLM